MAGLKDKAALNDGVKMPRFGLGVYLVKEGAEVENSVRYALEAGYRLVDTAAFYKNEAGVGKAIRESRIPREEIFVTTKLWNSDHGYEKAIRACEKSLKLLGMDYIDLYLIHWPGLNRDDRLAAWEAILKLKEQQKIRSAGVSNFKPHHIEDLISEHGVTPSVDQVELHPFNSQTELRRYAKEKSIIITAWGPLFHGHLSEAPATLNAIGGKYGKTGAQAVLRWHLQNGISIIPKSVKKHRIIENADIFDFELSDEDMKVIDGLNKDKAYGPDPDIMDFGFVNI
ncbi:MAG: Glyoxal reductase [Firmicutes bacterium ADurb.Bin182]|nr:MAG: Glyoxal reductase [Firmicutes bacterium ADurb.Bin182]